MAVPLSLSCSTAQPICPRSSAPLMTIMSRVIPGLGDWRVVAGVKIAHAMSYKLNDAQVARVAYTSVVANPTFGPDTFATADHIKAAAKPPANGSVPFQS